jgi:predicted RNA-binding Zn ribbon-like protein
MAILTVMGIDLSWADLVGGRLCLDFVNTIGSRLRAEPPPNEHLVDYPSLAAWAVHAGAIEEAQARRLVRKAATQPREAAAVVEEARALREALYRISVAASEDRAPAAADVARFNAHWARAVAEPRMTFGERGWAVGFQPADALTAPLDPIARSAAELLLSEDRHRVRLCESDDGCGWLFIDQTKSHTRRWCDMKVCGNRAKARRHYARRKDQRY